MKSKLIHSQPEEKMWTNRKPKTPIHSQERIAQLFLKIVEKALLRSSLELNSGAEECSEEVIRIPPGTF